MLYVPRHLPNKLEYKVFKLYFSPLSVTDGKQRERNHPSLSSYSAGRVMVLFRINMLGGRGVCRSSSGAVIGDLVDAAAWGIIPV